MKIRDLRDRGQGFANSNTADSASVKPVDSANQARWRLMIVGGTIITQLDTHGSPLMPRRLAWGLSGIGAALALYVFMADALRVSSHGAEAIRAVLPTSFNWGFFAIAFMLMSAPIVDLGWQSFRHRRAQTAS